MTYWYGRMYNLSTGGVMIFMRKLRSEGQTRAFTVQRDLEGWAAREEENNHTVKVVHCHDWHQVERLMTLFELKASELQQDGWREVPHPE
ncbi:MAG TPA: hypothetical protein VH702_02870 [Vicinamibacterales bacterium]|jgi:hypothetical protein